MGVIGIQKGPPERRVHNGFHGGHGSRAGDADRGDDCEGTTGLFSSEEADQGDLPRVSPVAQSRAQGDSLGGDEFHYERGRQPLPRIGPWRDRLDGLLLANEEKAARERVTLIRMWEELRELGYDGRL